MLAQQSASHLCLQRSALPEAVEKLLDTQKIHVQEDLYQARSRHGWRQLRSHEPQRRRQIREPWKSTDEEKSKFSMLTGRSGRSFVRVAACASWNSSARGSTNLWGALYQLGRSQGRVTCNLTLTSSQDWQRS